MDPNSSRRRRGHLLPLWVRWFLICLVLLIVVISTVLWIIQGAQAIAPIAVLTALGILITFFQMLPLLFPDDKQESTKSATKQSLLENQQSIHNQSYYLLPHSTLSDLPSTVNTMQASISNITN